MVAFGNPVQSYIRPPGSPLILGNFRVVCDFACHMARVPPVKGCDVGDGTCGKPVLAMTSGTISQVKLGVVGSTLSLDASIFRIKRSDGWEPAVAHLRIKAGLAVGQSIVEGAVVGTLDKVGASACHVHVGCKDPSGNEVDVWPLLKQNGAVDEDDGMDASFIPIPNRTVTVLKGARHRLAPTSLDATNIAILSDPGGPLGFPLMGTVLGVAPSTDPTNKLWYAYWQPMVKKVYYLHDSACGPETPWEATAGHTDQELAEAVHAAKHEAATVVSDAADSAASKYPV